jgi:D-glycerate 3-kinase
LSQILENALLKFSQQQRLPQSYLDSAQHWFAPVADALYNRVRTHAATQVLGIHGCQGSGKSTLAGWIELYLRYQRGLRVIVVSLDDFYLSKDQRRKLAEQVHPLLDKRGVPGTHDTRLALDTFGSLLAANQSSVVPVPRFDKAQDDRYSSDKWYRLRGVVDVIVFEGWCLGVPPQSEAALINPVNELEKYQDEDGSWRHYVNEMLAGDYKQLFGLVDCWLMLKAPSFGCVYSWRLEQEQKLANSRRGDQAAGIMDEQGIREFIQYYQRLTEHAMSALPPLVDYLYLLDESRKVVRYRGPGAEA